MIAKINQDTFCANPWSFMRINTTGDVSYCNRATDFVNQSLGSISQDFNQNQTFVAAREAMLNNQFPQSCNRCAAEETFLNGAYRKSQNFRAAIHHNEFFIDSVKQSPIYPLLDKKDILPQQLFVMFSNKCNLACRMCSRHTSSGISSLYNKHNYIADIGLQNGVEHYPPVFVADDILDWTTDRGRWNDFLTFVTSSTSLQLLQINGGEPFIQSQFYELIDACISANRTDLKLVITSNATVVDEIMLKKLQQFNSCFIDFSIESLHPSNDYVRTGSVYTNIADNIKTMLAYKTDQLSFGIHLTPTAYTAETLDTVLDFCIEHDLEIIGNQSHPQQFLQPRVLPAEIKQLVKNNILTKYKNITSNGSLSEMVTKLVEWLSVPESDMLEDLRTKFVKHTMIHDSMLGTKFHLTFPHLAEFYKKYGYNCN